MSCVKALWFLLVLVLLSLVQCNEICDTVDVKCMTHAARNAYKTAVAGIEGLIEPIDPLFIADVKGELPYTKYTLSNPKMTGMKHCQVTQLVFQPDEVKFEYELYCPSLVLHFGYEAKGTFGPLKVDGDGQVKVTLDDYTIIIKGETERYTSVEDNKLRVHVKSFFVESKPNGQISFEVDNLVHGDKEKSEQVAAYVNEHAMDVEKYLRPAVIDEFMKIFIERLNVMFTSVPYDELVPKI